MSTNSLLSLLAKQSARVSSLANKHGISSTFSFTPRSSSTSIHKHEVSSGNTQRSSQLYRVTHLLNVKVKQNYFYGFCKIEQISKSRKTDKTALQNIKENLDKSSEKGVPAEQESVPFSEEVNKMEKMQEGIDKLVDFSATFSKLQVRTREGLLKDSFRALQKHFLCISLASKTHKIIAFKTQDCQREFLGALKQIQNSKIRGHIFIESLAPIFKNRLILSFEALNGWRPQKVAIESATRLQLYSEAKYFAQDPKQSDPSFKNCHQISEIPAIVDCSAKPKKIKLKDKRVAPAKAIQLQKKVLKTKILQLRSDVPLKLSSPINESQSEHMQRFINLKSQPIATPIPDLIDNCYVFRESSFASLTSSHITTFESCVSEHKQSVEPIQTDDCQTERYPRCDFPQERKAPSNSKHHSTGKTIAKGTDTQDCSPKVSIQEILKNIQGLSNFKSAEREKKMVNVNLPRNLYESTVPISVFSKTPLKQGREDQVIFRSDNKENMGERLVTERAKHCSNNQKGDLQEGGKHKSTVLVRERRSKIQKSQQFTARKMKIEIENIINRRNRQLTSRNQVRQLK